MITIKARVLSILIAMLVSCSFGFGYMTGHFTTKSDMDKHFEMRRQLVAEYVRQSQETIRLLQAKADKPCRNKPSLESLLLSRVATGTATVKFYAENNAGGRRLMKRTAPYGLVACDLAYWKRGTLFVFDKLGAYICNDTGSAIKGRWMFDVFRPDKDIPSVGVMKLKTIAIGR